MLKSAIWAFSILVFLLAGSGTRAATWPLIEVTLAPITFDADTPIPVSWTNVAIPQFDPALGTLTGISMTLTGTLRGSVGMENLLTTESNQFNATWTTDLTLSGNGASLVVSDLTASLSHLLGPYDNGPDFRLFRVSCGWNSCSDVHVWRCL